MRGVQQGGEPCGYPSLSVRYRPLGKNTVTRASLEAVVCASLPQSLESRIPWAHGLVGSCERGHGGREMMEVVEWRGARCEVGTGRLAGAIVDLGSAEWVGCAGSGSGRWLAGWLAQVGWLGSRLGCGLVDLWTCGLARLGVNVWVWMRCGWMRGSLSHSVLRHSNTGVIGNWPRRVATSPKRGRRDGKVQRELRAGCRNCQVFGVWSVACGPTGLAQTDGSGLARGIEGCITSHARYRHGNPHGGG